MKYPPRRRGGDCVVNPNYNYSPYVNDHDARIAPCVVWSLRAHFMLTDPSNANRKNEQDLLEKSWTGQYSFELYNKLYKYKVSLPPACTSTGNFSNHHFADLEKANKLPIILYQLVKQKKHVKNQDVRYNLHCIRTPSPDTLKLYGFKNVCHLLMVSDSHVCYIPNIKKYLNNALEPTKYGVRCQICFNCFKTEEALSYHLNNAICYSKSRNPPSLSFKDGDYISHINPGSEYLPEITFIADSEAMIIPVQSNINGQDIDGDDDDDNVEGFDGPIYPNERPAGKVSDHICHSIGIIALDYKLDIIEHKQLWGIGCGLRFYDTIQGIIDRYMEKVKNERFLKIAMTNDDWKKHERATQCMYCKKDLSGVDSKKIHRHHSHTTKPIYKKVENYLGQDLYECVSGNYLGKACASCNWSATSKRTRVNVLMHNMSNYDGPLLISDLVKSRKHDLRGFEITPKGTSAYHCIRYRNICLIDSLSFLQGSISKLVDLHCKQINNNNPEKTIEKILPITTQCIKESRFNNNVIPLLTSKLSYPYNLPRSIDDFTKIRQFPKKESFYDDLTESHISDSDYENTKKVYEIANCQCLRDLHDLYLTLDIGFLSDLWRSFNKQVFDNFKVYPSNHMNGAALSFRAGIKSSETNIELLSDMSMYDVFHNSVRGGYCAVNIRHSRCNNVDLGPKYYDKNKESSIAIFPDFNGLYSWCLKQPLPYGGFRYLSKSELSKYRDNFRLFLDYDRNNDSETGLYLTVDFYIPTELAMLTDDMPLSIIKTTRINPSPYTKSVGGDKASQEKLIAGHFPLQKYSFHIRLLKLYITLGVIITKIHSAIEFKQKKLFAKYINHCSKQRQKASKMNDPVQKHFYKLMPNSLYGKTLQNEICFDTTSVICHTGLRYQKLCTKYQFRSRKWLIPDKIALVVLTKDTIKLRSPIFIGSTILQLSKLKNLSFETQVVKPSCAIWETFNIRYPINIVDEDIIIQSRKIFKACYLQYADTDSLLYIFILTDEAKYMTHDEIFRKTFLNKYLDRSNFTVLSTESQCEAGELGYLKSEVGDNVILETICLSPKCYSIMSIRRDTGMSSQKQALKGCPPRIASKIFTHEIFRKVLFDNHYNAPVVGFYSIKKQSGVGVGTVRYVKTCASLVENKRWWYNAIESVAFHHPSILNSGEYKLGDIISGHGAIIEGSLSPTDIPYPPPSSQPV